MASKITRRKALAAGMATTGALFGSVSSRDAHAWPPGPKENVPRDLTPGSTPLRIGTGLPYNEKESFDEIVKKIRYRGYGGSLIGGGEPWYSMEESKISELRAALKKYDVVVYEVAGYCNMIEPDRAKQQENLKGLARAIEVADKVGCPMVGTITGSCDPVYGYGIHPDNWSEETWKRTVDAVKQVLRDTSGMKAALGMEAQVTTNLDGPKAHKRLMDDVGDKRCAVNLDPVNMMSLANYYHTTELLNECFDLLGEQILGCHSKDTYIWPDRQTVHVQEVATGRGVMDYETYLVRLSRMKWPRTLFPEHVPHEQLIEAKGYIETVAARVGVAII